MLRWLSQQSVKVSRLFFDNPELFEQPADLATQIVKDIQGSHQRIGQRLTKRHPDIFAAV